MPTSIAPGLTTGTFTAPPTEAARGPLLGRLAAAIAQAREHGPLRCLTTVHPCFINGVRTLVHKRGLANSEPGVFQRLRDYAASNGFDLLEDRRKRELTCRDERRRLAPLLMFAATLLGDVAMADDGALNDGTQAVVPTIEVIGTRIRTDDGREYLSVGGKRFITEPMGEVEQILEVAAEVRARGDHHRVRTRGLQMPSEYTASFIDRYDYTLPSACGGQQFSYYEGDGFSALGYHGEDGKVVLDVLAGGGPFSAPRLWGAYDQVLNANVRMDLMFGDGLKDGMGVMMASYKIGLMPVMRAGSKSYYGELYSRAVALAAECQAPGGAPTVRQAEAASSGETG